MLDTLLEVLNVEHPLDLAMGFVLVVDKAKGLFSMSKCLLRQFTSYHEIVSLGYNSEG